MKTATDHATSFCAQLIRDREMRADSGSHERLFKMLVVAFEAVMREARNEVRSEMGDGK